MAKFDYFLSLDCDRVEGWGRNPRKRSDQILQCSVASSLKGQMLTILKSGYCHLATLPPSPFQCGRNVCMPPKTMNHVAGAFVIRSVDQILPYCVIRDSTENFGLEFLLEKQLEIPF